MIHLKCPAESNLFMDNSCVKIQLSPWHYTENKERKHSNHVALAQLLTLPRTISPLTPPPPPWPCPHYLTRFGGLSADITSSGKPSILDPQSQQLGPSAMCFTTSSHVLLQKLNSNDKAVWSVIHIYLWHSSLCSRKSEFCSPSSPSTECRPWHTVGTP